MTERSWRAVEDIYHAYLTGLILHAVTRRGAADAAELVFRTFRAQRLARFLPGLIRQTSWRLMAEAGPSDRTHDGDRQSRIV